MYDEFKIVARIGTGDLAKQLNKFTDLYKNIQLVQSIRNVHYFIAERKYGENFKSLYEPKQLEEIN